MAKYSDGLDAVAVAMSHPGRRRIVDLLRNRAATTSELAGLLDLGLPGTTKHLGVLDAAGLLRSTKSGRSVTHELVLVPLERYADWLQRRRSFWSEQLDALADDLSRTDGSR